MVMYQSTQNATHFFLYLLNDIAVLEKDKIGNLNVKWNPSNPLNWNSLRIHFFQIIILFLVLSEP